MLMLHASQKPRMHWETILTAEPSSLQEHVAAAAACVGRFLVENERLLVVAASTMIMSLSHTALRPVLPVFAKVSRNSVPLVINALHGVMYTVRLASRISGLSPTWTLPCHWLKHLPVLS